MTITRKGLGVRFHQVVEAGGFVFLAGIVANDTSGDTAAQTKDILDQIDALLVSVGSSKAQIVTANIWLSDIKTIGAMNTVWDVWLDKENAPVRATVESKLAAPEYLVEIQVKAFKG
ncbi:RidA family protein [Rhizobium sp. KVB221]|uniref:RidA family protein n=1 Tax=Rhizobium setariae TaxID=2801340 RepID=A0A937CR10_9HYPH|nr:RidA family protein [Rhizobium setariae]MBL0373747.1 RidA family protein [Rhizobium setariae]